MKIYAISGLGADHSVFQYLNLPHPLTHLKWIPPLKKELLSEYAIRLSSEIDTTQEFSLIGVSFGGMIAVEIAKVLKPKFTVLVSSAVTYTELPWVVRLPLLPELVYILPPQLLKPPPFIAHFLFGTQKKALLNAILTNTDSRFTKWAVGAILSWQNKQKPTGVISIKGTADKIIPIKKGDKHHLIEGGGHFMIVDKARQIESLLLRKVFNA